MRSEASPRGGVRGHLVHGDHRRFRRQRVDQHHQPGVEHQRLADEAGGVTVEAAFAIAALVVVLILCVSGLTAVSMQVRCVDAAREAARLAARGDDGSASGAAQGIAPDGAAVQLRRDGEFVIARVTANSPLLPGITIAAETVAAAVHLGAGTGTACSQASTLARAMGTAVTQCVVITVETRVALGRIGVGPALATARAGPVDSS